MIGRHFLLDLQQPFAPVLPSLNTVWLYIFTAQAPLTTVRAFFWLLELLVDQITALCEPLSGDPELADC